MLKEAETVEAISCLVTFSLLVAFQMRKSPGPLLATPMADTLSQGRLVMKAKKAAAYPASSVFIINIFILGSFRIAVVTSN